MQRSRRRLRSTLQCLDQIAQGRRRAERLLGERCREGALDPSRELHAAEAVEPQIAFQRAIQRDRANPCRAGMQLREKLPGQRQYRSSRSPTPGEVMVCCSPGHSSFWSTNRP